MNLSGLSIRHSALLLVAVVTAIVWGSVSFIRLPRQEDPTLTWRLANVITRLPGASPERIESLITDVLEQHVEEVDQVEHVYSVSRAGVSLVQIELSDEVTVAQPVWQKVRNKLSEAAGELPAGVSGPDLDDEIMGTFTQLVAISGPDSYRELESYAEALEQRLRYLPSTASTDLFGIQPQVIEVAIDPIQLAAYDLSLEHVAAVLGGRNVKWPSGRMQVDENRVLIETSGELESEFDLRDLLLLSTESGRTLRLGDVATIRRTTRTPPEPPARFNGGPAVIVGVRARTQQRIDHYGDRVQEIVESYAGTLRPGVRCTVFHDLAQYTRQRTAQLGRTLLLSVASVFLATAAFMGWRGACVVTAVIPLTGLIVLIFFSVVGLPLHQMSVMAIIMAFGLLVDDAILVVEQVHRRVAEGGDVRQAAAEEPARLFSPMLVSTLTTISAFLPIYLLSGGVGEFVRAIPVGVSICLVVAFGVSVTLAPWLCTQLLGKAPVPIASRFSHSIEQQYRWLLEASMMRPFRSVAVAAVVLIGLAALGGTLRRDFFSPVQRDQFVVDVVAPQGTAVEHTAEVVERVEAVLDDQQEVASVAAFVGRNAPLIFYNLQSQETHANHFAQLVVRVDDWQQTASVAARVQSELNAKITNAHCCAHILNHGAPLVAPFEVRIRGPSIPTLRELGRRTAAILRQTPGVRNIRDNYGKETLKLVAQVNEPVARRIGIDQAMVADQLRRRLDGFTVSHLREGDERIPISVRLPLRDRQNTEDLTGIYFKPSPQSELIPFSAVATLIPTWEAASIYRRDGQRTLSVLAYPEFGLTAAQVAARFRSKLAALQNELPEGYTLELGGENEQRHEAETGLLANSVYAFCLMVLFLTYEFRRLRLAFLVLTLVPLSIGGVMFGLFLTGWPLNFMAIMGMMVLFGVVVNDAVILVDRFEQRRKQMLRGAAVSVTEARRTFDRMVVQATLERSRHVVITTVTTIAGFLPLALSPSLLWPPLAVAVIGGISLATLLTLIALPAAYSILRVPRR